LNVEEISLKLMEALAELLELPLDEITARTEFRSLAEWDSLAHLSLVTIVESDFDVLLTEKDFQGLKTIHDLVDYVAKYSP